MVVKLTKEERQRIAAKLRKTEIEKLSTYEYSTHLDEAVGECVRLVSGHEILVKRGLDRLADFIEPEPERTCRMKKKESKYVLSGWWECSECGIVYPPCDEEIALWALQYCPHCGAKVVKND